MKMEWFRLLILLAIQKWISMATRIFHVLPDNSSNVNCPFQPCATLSQYLLDNSTLPVVSNVQYSFLPGEHHVPASMVLQNLHNFSIIGIFRRSSPPVVLVGCLQSYVIKVINSYNVTITNVVFKRCDQTHFKNLTSLLIDICYSCTIENIVFVNLGLTGTNLLGKSQITEIVIKSDETQTNLLVFCQGLG